MAFGEPAQRRVDRRDLLPRLFEQGRRVLPLEGQRCALGVVLVVGPARAGCLGELRELPLQRGYPPHRLRPLRRQHLARVCHQYLPHVHRDARTPTHLPTMGHVAHQPR